VFDWNVFWWNLASCIFLFKIFFALMYYEVIIMGILQSYEPESGFQIKIKVLIPPYYKTSSRLSLSLKLMLSLLVAKRMTV
jgi:hypothetical protein